MKFLHAIALAILLCSTASAGILENLQPGHWVEIPNSKIAPLCPSPTPPGSTGCAAVITAWVGAYYDSRRQNYGISGGGHGDSSDNSQYLFNLISLSWTRFWGPTPNAQIIPLNSSPVSQCPGFVGVATREVNLDCNPTARHPYSGQQYLPNQDRLFFHGGSLWGGSGGMGRASWSFDFDHLTFTLLADIGACYVGPSVPYAVYDPNTGMIYAHKYNSLCQYDPVANSWKRRGTYGPGISPGAGTAFDPVRKKMYLIGGGATRFYDLASTATLIPMSFPVTTGDKTIEGKPYPGCDYEPTINRIICWSGDTSGPGDVFEFNHDTMSWARLTPAQGSPLPPVLPTSGGGAGVHTRWRYIPNKHVFVVVNSINQNVWAYRLSALPGGSAPDAATNLDVVQ